MLHPPERTKESQSASTEFLIKFLMSILRFDYKYILFQFQNVMPKNGLQCICLVAKADFYFVEIVSVKLATAFIFKPMKLSVFEQLIFIATFLYKIC